MMHAKDWFEVTGRRRWMFGVVSAIAITAGGIPVGAQSAAAPESSQPPTIAEPGWKSSPYHGVVGGDGRIIPCRCLYRGRQYQLGEKVCMQTYRGTVITECDLQLNNTSWVPTDEACTTS